jgi:hypothetical protein
MFVLGASGDIVVSFFWNGTGDNDSFTSKKACDKYLVEMK